MFWSYNIEVIEHTHWLAVISVALHLINGATVWRWQKSAMCISFGFFKVFRQNQNCGTPQQMLLHALCDQVAHSRRCDSRQTTNSLLCCAILKLICICVHICQFIYLYLKTYLFLGAHACLVSTSQTIGRKNPIIHFWMRCNVYAFVIFWYLYLYFHIYLKEKVKAKHISGNGLYALKSPNYSTDPGVK